MDETDYRTRLAELLDASGWTQEEFEARSGVPVRTLQAILAGKSKRPQRTTREGIERAAAQIEAALGLSTPEKTTETWPRDVRAFLDTLGAFLVYTLPEDEREEWIHQENRRIFEEFGARRRER